MDNMNNIFLKYSFHKLVEGVWIGDFNSFQKR